jgi:hypothetical protein
MGHAAISSSDSVRVSPTTDGLAIHASWSFRSGTEVKRDVLIAVGAMMKSISPASSREAYLADQPRQERQCDQFRDADPESPHFLDLFAHPLQQPVAGLQHFLRGIEQVASFGGQTRRAVTAVEQRCREKYLELVDPL